ncbi:E3 ubiquitin-protein ligase siah-1-like [Aricia agestis]|uniref:E3 ubiquitin-protein ligase siah-1-like n=1 Tax=Aricia agestis TaxID=91739 RepID=UPI001C2048D1|nr:E3 ubiquitin-protein ligase siah-1-like [Aricia agestis]
MGNQKENLKKALGITDYPWSSDDDDDTHTAAEATSRFSNDNDAANSSRLTVQPQAPNTSLSPRIRNPTKLERDLFWRMLHHPRRIPPTSDPARPGPSSCQPIDSGHCIDLESKFSNIARMIAINKLPRKVPRLSSYRSSLPLLPVSPLERPRNRSSRSSQGDRIPPTIDVTTTEPRPNQPAALDQDSGINNSLSDDEVDSRLRVFLDESHDDSNENGNSTAAQATENPRPEEIVVEIEPDIEVVDNGGTDNAQSEQRPTEQANEESNAASNDNEPNTSRQAVKRKADDHDDNEISSVREFNQSVLRLLECPVCMEWMEPPMSQCRRGHLVCGGCRARLAACPVCRTAFSSVRNRAMEAVAELLRYPCRHGCGREARLRRRSAHEASCGARRYRCPVPACAERAPFPLAELHYHFQARHLPILKVGRRHRFSMRVSAQQHDTWLVAAARELFHLRVDVDVGSWGLVVYVAYIGPRCNAKNFTYEVTVTGQHNSRKLVYTRATHSDLESSTMNVNRQDCFHLTLDQALNFIRQKNRLAVPDKFLDFVVEINKREPPPATAQEQSDS